ncbi:MAG: hypothetical protein ACOX55_08100 [Christensenellales bacterium]|jgi:putative aldouronate transport system substrate-binding protein
MQKRLISLLLVIALLLGAGMMTAVAQEGKTIRMLVGTQSFDMNTNYVGVLLEEITGYKVQYDYYADDNQLALEIASGTEYDLISVSPNMYQTLLAQGALKNLSAAIEAHPSVKDAISPLGWTYCTAADDGIYGVPNVDDAVYVGGIGYRTDIFAEHGYQEPATVQEFYDLLVAIKNDTGLIPLTGRNAVEPVIASGFGLSYDFVVDEETDKIVSWLRDPGMKEYLAWMNKVYTEGLIDVDWPVNTGDQINEKISSNQAVMTFAAHWHTLNWVNALVENGHKDAYFKTIVPLEDAEGKRHIAVSNGISRVFVVPVTASDEDAVYTMGMIASRLDAENYWAFNDGIEGTHYTKGEDGIPVPILPKFNDDMNQGSNYQIGRNQHEHPITWMARVHKTQVQWDTFYDANSKAAAFGFEGRPLTFARFPEYTEYSSALSTLCGDYFMQVIAGTETLDSYDDFVKEWEEAGGLALEEAATAWYHANPELVNAARESTSPYNAIFGYEIK